MVIVKSLDMERDEADLEKVKVQQLEKERRNKRQR